MFFSSGITRRNESNFVKSCVKKMLAVGLREGVAY